MTAGTDKGVIDATERILAQLLKKPFFKSCVRTVLNNIDPDASKQLARTMLWQDVEVTLSFVAAIPSMANALIKFSDEVLIQVREKFPQMLLDGYVEEIIADIDTRSINRIKKNASMLFDELYPVIQREYVKKTGKPETEKKVRMPVEEKKGLPVEGGPNVRNETYSELFKETSDFDPTGNGERHEGSILEELLQTAFLKDILREYLNSIDPEKGSSFVRSFLWKDMEVPFSIFGALPAVINLYIHAIDELGTQLLEKIPPRLLKGYAADIMSDIDTVTAKNCLVSYKNIIKKMMSISPELEPKALDFIKGPVPVAVISNSINGSLGYINRIEKKNPGVVTEILAGVLSNIDKDVLNQTAKTITNAFLDQKPSFVKMSWNFIKMYIKRIFKRENQ